MILDLPRLIAIERPYWSELEQLLNRLEQEPNLRLTVSEVERLHYLYQRAAACLARIATFSAEPGLQQTVESLVARAYSEMHAQAERGFRLQLREWFLHRCPATFRARAREFALAGIATLIGMMFGAAILLLGGAEEKIVLMPFSHLRGNPNQRVAREERGGASVRGHEAEFAASLMSHNIRVSLFVFALGMTFGVGTLVLLFYNGVILGAAAADYVHAGQTQFLLGWLLPHGAAEIPAILIAGQAGLVLAAALVGPRHDRRSRLRAASEDILALLTLLAGLLVWAGFVEAFLSQYHEPVLPYALKIAFGVAELGTLVLFLRLSGKKAARQV